MAVWPEFDDVERLIAGLEEIHETKLRIANRELLESAISLPHLEYYETFWDKLAAMVRSVAANHALVDGNKRLAHTLLHVTLCANRYLWLWSQEDGEQLILRIAKGETEFDWLATFLWKWHLPMDELTSMWFATATTLLDGSELIGLIRRVREQAVEEGPGADSLFQLIASHARGDLSPETLQQFEIERAEST